MKSRFALILASLAFASSAFAADIVPQRQVRAVHIDSIDTTVVGQGHPVQQVKVKATFGNACTVPTGDELVKIVTIADDGDTLIIALGNDSDRICTREYAPVTVTIDLGQYTRPADGLFDTIIVNGVELAR